jgi:hypothetical protein
MPTLASIFKKGASEEGEIPVDISYDIIRHVSAQLYTNPRKAIEELVCNGYDAGATECHVTLPSDERAALLVLDNGKSMSFAGLRDLWRVADSPKKPNSKGSRIANNRLQIGKFGVGKLAAYALGKRLTHVATTGGVTRVISVGEDEIRTRSRGGAPKFKVYKVTAAKARPLLQKFFEGLPSPWERGWDSWTLAVVENIEEDQFNRALKIGILRRMITTALPLSAEFTAFLDGDQVPTREIPEEEIELTVDILDPAFRKKLELDLQAFWKSQLNLEQADQVEKRLYKIKLGRMPRPQEVTQQIPAIVVPELGLVAGNAVVTRQTLTTEKLGERGYVNHGFAVYAYGKLVNPEDELFGVSPRTHSVWRRFLARVEIPGLDDVLLVQRNAVSENSPKAQVAREVMRVLFEFARSLAEKHEEGDDFKPQAFGSKMQRSSPLLAPLAIGGLGGGALPGGGVSEVDIGFVALTENGPASRYDVEDHDIQINEDHPIIDALQELGAPRQKQWRRVMGEVIAGSKLTQGLLIARGVEPENVRDAEELMDSALRSAASFIRDPVEEHIREIEEASYVGGTRFENAVVNAFKSLRLVSNQMGGPDNPDGVVEVPMTGSENLRVSIEAKGTNGIITHAELSEATVTRHQKESGCTSSVAIAREFQNEGRSGRESGLMRETKGKLPLLTVSAIARMLRLHRRRPFTYDKVAKILTTWTRPDELEEFIEKTWRELPELGLMRLVLEVAHEKSKEHDLNFPDPGMLVGDPRLVRRRTTKDQIRHILEAVAVTTGMVVIQNTTTYEFAVMAPVETILDAMTTVSQEPGPSNKPPSTKKK